MQVLDTNNYLTEDGTIHHNSGKTFVGCLDLGLFAAANPGTTQGYFGISYPSIRDIFYPTFEEAAALLGFNVKIKFGDKEVDLYRGRIWYGKIICRSMDNPASIVGFKVARALVDEIDTLPKDKAKLAWNKIIARLRLVIPGVVNGIGVTTTPEGFRFVYDRFRKDPTASYSMVRASSHENAANLPEDYISSLQETYPDELVAAYVDGRFVNLTSGTVYKNFCRTANDSKHFYQPGENIHVGMDFNVNKMAARIAVLRGSQYHFVAEIDKGTDTESVCNTIESRFPGSRVTVYPDASGKNTSSKGASLSDISIINSHGFSVVAKAANPPVKDRIISVNKAFENKHLAVNCSLCPNTAQDLEQQPYDKNGAPDKDGGHDHGNDALGYLAYSLFPVVKPVIYTGMRMGQR